MILQPKFILSSQYIRAFRVLKTVDKGTWSTHHIISKIHLNPASNPADNPYQRSVPPPPDHVDKQGQQH